MKITKSKKNGGLGLQSAKEKNIALLAKLNWRFHPKKDSLWAWVLSHKYRPWKRQPLSRSRICSTTWTTLKKGEKVFKSGIKWIIGNDSNLTFWFDKWMSEGSVRNLIMGLFEYGGGFFISQRYCSKQQLGLGEIILCYSSSLSPKN